MDNQKQLQFYIGFENLIRALTNLEHLDMEQINTALSELCKLLRISKGITRFYHSPEHEQKGKGRDFVCYDAGIESVLAIRKRIVTDAMTVTICEVYADPNQPPLTEWEHEKTELIMQTVMSFVSRHMLQYIVEKLMFYDDVGYRNLRYFTRAMERERSKAPLLGKAAVRYNLRHFSLINQEIGRSAGDIVMRRHFEGMSERLGSDGVVCRIGGDNFVLLCPQSRLEDIVAYLTETPVEYDVNSGKRIMVSAYAGIFCFHTGMESSGEAMDKMMSAVNQAKNGGKEPIVYYSDEMRSSKEHAMRIQQMFPEAIKNEEFRVFYQPKIDVCTGELAGAEALCRWFREGRIVPPMEFIPVLEQTSEICTLDFYMLDHVCQDIRRWLDEGRKLVRVSVNLSRKHMMDIDLLEHILEIVDRNHVPHQYIEIELTETTTDVEFRDLKRVVSGLQQAGIYTSVDDFGMGYSSLNLIREIPWNVLKVDRSFLPVEEDQTDSTRSIMFKYVVAMARELGLECIAEGVETKRQVDVLRSNRCELAQGFFFDKPLAVTDFENRLRIRRYSLKDGQAV